jgi:hypothetical protein
MGRVIIKMKDGHLESFKCKSKERAAQIASKRPNSKEWNYYSFNERVPVQHKKVVNKTPSSFEEIEAMMKQQRLIY